MDGANPSCHVTACSDSDQCADRRQPRCRGPWTRRPEALRPRLSRGCALVWRVAVYMNAVDESGRPAAKRSIEASIKHWRGLGRSGPQACPQLLGASCGRTPPGALGNVRCCAMDATLQRLAREAGVNEIVDLRRHDAGPALELFAALVAERCASIAAGVPLDHAASRTMDSPQQTAREIAVAIRAAFPMPGQHG